ncbi:LysR family transcriptional regulator [Vibrio navarrensis]|uniref:LysR family transcriptional regulator n=1 Tax=Vibrio navarrensis TaxID=29495 RepID=UPI001869978C|nr:LysR family transcriptional regulator [Vibrio navarrensis]MBE4576995.1 LysR family transcriptional regulator [Vibrio navarrensis]MBE4595907.1 LysR family transcriptional regulator [Vibrio navarrensis]
MLNPIWLNTFKTLVDVGHFTHTAEKLHMTQPGVSQHIRKLEELCGHALIKRINKTFELTEQGKLVYEYAVKSADAEARLFASLEFDNPFSGVCKLSCSGSLALQLYPQLLSLQQAHLDLKIHLEAAPNQKIFNDLQTDMIDLGIVTQKPDERLFQSTVLGSETLCLVLPKRYKESEINADLLCNIGVIDHPDAQHYLSIYFKACELESLSKINLDKLPKSGYVNQLSQILLPVSRGLGFTVLPKSAITNFVDSESLFVVRPKTEVRETLYLVQKRNRDLAQRYHTVNSYLARIFS